MGNKTPDIDAKEWEQVLRESNWHRDYEQELFKKFLGAQHLGEVNFNDYRTSEAGSLVYRYCITDFFRENGFQLDKVIQTGSDGEYAPSYSNIEYAAGKYKSCLLNGAYFISKGDTRFIVTLEQLHEGYLFKVAAHREQRWEPAKFIEELLEYGRKHNFLIGKKIDASCNFIKLDKDYSWDDLILPVGLKDSIRQNLSNLIDHRDIYQVNKLPIKRGLIFSGPPGSGKTTLAKILCKTINWTFLWITPKHMIHPKYIAAIVDLAKELSPTVMFLEDIDLYGGSRETNANVALLGELMNQLDGVQENKDIITLATTNKPEILEKALIDRPGRFDKELRFDMPDLACREMMLKHFSATVNVDSGVNFQHIAQKTNGLAGAHIRELVNLAVIHAIDSHSYDSDKKITLKKEHLKAAISSVQKKDFSKVIGITGHQGPADDLSDDF